MTHNTNIQQTGRTDIRTTRKLSRLHLALASSGVAGALLLGGLFGFPGESTTMQEHTVKPAAPIIHQETTAPALRTHSTGDTTIALAYSVPNASYMDIARQAAINAGINPDAFVRQIQQESGFNPGAVSPAGAVGIAQFMPATAASMGVNPHDPVQALNGAARLMANLSSQFGGDYAKALAAYNAGPGTVQSAVARGGGNWLGFTPSETQNYVHSIMG